MYVLEEDGWKRRQTGKKKEIGLNRCKLCCNKTLHHDILDYLWFVSVWTAAETVLPPPF